MITRVLHTGLMIDDLDAAIKFYERLGFILDKKFEKPEPKAKAAHMKHHNGSGIELWEFTDINHEQVEYVKHHLALETDDLENDLQALIQSGAELVIPITKGVTLTYAYIRDKSGNYIEIAKKLT